MNSWPRIALHTISYRQCITNETTVFCGFTANLIFYWTGKLAWKFQIASTAVPAGVLIALVWTIPESPRWLLKKGRGAEAFSALCDLRPTQLQAATELLYANAQIQMELKYFQNAGNDVEATPKNAISSEQEGSSRVEYAQNQDIDDLASFSRYRDAVKATNYLKRITRLFFTRRIRRSTVAASVCMIGQQLCGVYKFLLVLLLDAGLTVMQERSDILQYNFFPRSQRSYHEKHRRLVAKLGCRTCELSLHISCLLGNRSAGETLSPSRNLPGYDNLLAGSFFVFSRRDRRRKINPCWGLHILIYLLLFTWTGTWYTDPLIVGVHF